jgi:hypothetical protein
MNLLSEDLFVILQKKVSEDTPHTDYDRTVSHAKWCKQVVTGDDQQDILVTYKSRESQEQQEQRIRVTNSRTQYVTNKVKKLYNEVHRCDDVTESVTYPNKEDTAVTGLLDALNKWYENKPLKNYISTRFKDLVFEDPNAYIIVEFENDDPIKKKPTPYPFEVRSSEVYYPHYINGVLQYLIIFENIEYKTRKYESVWGYKYTMYAVGTSFVFMHVPKEAVYETPDGWDELKMKYGKHKGEQRFVYREFESKTTECPAFRVGYMDDPETNGRTKVNPMYPAKNIITDLQWNKSEYDLSKALHGFYQKFVFVEPCKVCSGEGHVNGHRRTYNDEYEDYQEQCGVCKGSGKDMHTTTQDVVALNMPGDKEQFFDLSKLVYFAQIPGDLITKQREDFISDQKDVFNCIFGANVLERSELVETATAKNYDWRAVNNTLFEYADHVSDFFKFSVRLAANHRGEIDGLVVQHSHPYDFKLESVQDLIDQRGSSVTAGSPMVIVASFDLAILAKQHKDDPEFIQGYKAREKFRPMRDKSREEKMILLSTLPTDDPEKILYTYFERIMDDIFDEHVNFAEYAYQKQRAIVYSYVDKMIQAKAKPLLNKVLASSMGEEE